MATALRATMHVHRVQLCVAASKVGVCFYKQGLGNNFEGERTPWSEGTASRVQRATVCLRLSCVAFLTA